MQKSEGGKKAEQIGLITEPQTKRGGSCAEAGRHKDYKASQVEVKPAQHLKIRERKNLL